MKRLHLRNRLLALNLFVLIGKSTSARAWCNRRYEAQLEGPMASGLAFIDTPKAGGLECVIWLPYFRKGNAFDAGTLAHEALHVAWRLLDKIGIHDEETHCYMVQWIVEELTRRLAR